MRIVALLAVRNEELYLERCLRHLITQGVEVCLIDNGSTDGSRDIAQRFLGNGVSQIEDHPYPGYLDLVGILQAKERLASTIDADWFMHHDVDEIRESPDPSSTLHHAFYDADAAGYTAIEFDELVFLPTLQEESFEHTDYVANMRYYYYFAPWALHRLNAWKKMDMKVDLREKRGHQVQFPGRKISSMRLVLRHYIFLSVAHGQRKYGERVYSKFEMEKLGWQRKNRAGWGQGQLILPPRSALKRLACPEDPLDCSEPHRSTS